jgi:hypothetical protein
MVRAKFRVMEISRQWNGKLTVVRLLPVIAKAPEGSGYYVDPEGSEENRAFWDATPSGEAELVFKGFDVPAPFGEVGKCVYIDMEQLDVEPPEDERKNHWKLESVKTSYSLEIALSYGWRDQGMTTGSIKMDIHNEGAWPPFQGKHLTHWSVVFTPAAG